MKQFSLFDKPPTEQELHFIKECRSVAITLGLCEVNPAEIENRVKLSEKDYQKMMMEVDRR